MYGEPVKSCTIRAATATRYEITTVEGLERDGVLDRQGFDEEHSLQCRLCARDDAHRPLDPNPDPSDDGDPRGDLGQICRCTGYATIVSSIRWAAEHPAPDVAYGRRPRPRHR
jgi:carbon-monoxide dehydrogenase small subunit